MCGLLLLSSLSLSVASESVFYVSPKGSDRNPGTKERPFLTLERARAAVRAAPRTGPRRVYLESGTYYLKDPFVLSERDGGTRLSPVLYCARGPQQAVVSGGVLLRGTWKVFRAGIWVLQVPPGTEIDEFFAGGKRQVCARYPDFDPEVAIFNGYSRDCLAPERVHRWRHVEGGYIHALHRNLWGDLHWRITGKDSQGRLRYEGGWQNNRPGPMHQRYRYVENIFEELDCAGEWYLDRRTWKLYWWPPEGTDPRTVACEGSRLRTLIALRGTKEHPVRFVSFRGITFRHAVRTFMETCEPLLRSDWAIYRGGAFFATGTENCAIEGCFFDQLGGNAVFVSGYNRAFTVRACHIYAAGASGIAFVGEPSAVRNPLFRYNQSLPLEALDRAPGPKTEDYPRECAVEDCLVHLTGRFEKQSAGVQISMARRITVRHTSIHDVPRAGINIGDGTWGGHVIEWCDVFNTVLETGDHGSFNSWGRDRFWHPNRRYMERINAGEKPLLPLLDAVEPVTLRFNRFRCDRGWDIDLDDGSTHYHIYKNLCLHGGIKNREGFYRICENNIMVDNSFHPHVWFRNSNDTFRRNIVFTPYRPIRVPAPWGKEIDYNLLHVPGKSPAEHARVLAGLSGRDAHSLAGDAMFVDPRGGDWCVKDNSPALRLGFENFPMDRFGVREPSLRAKAKTPKLPDVRRAERR